MIDYDRAESDALRLACGIAALEFVLLVAGAFYAL
jgi:hypothetical protein